jgi:hypothetical protein
MQVRSSPLELLVQGGGADTTNGASSAPSDKRKTIRRGHNSGMCNAC